MVRSADPAPLADVFLVLSTLYFLVSTLYCRLAAIGARGHALNYSVTPFGALMLR